MTRFANFAQLSRHLAQVAAAVPREQRRALDEIGQGVAVLAAARRGAPADGIAFDVTSDGRGWRVSLGSASEAERARDLGSVTAAPAPVLGPALIETMPETLQMIAEACAGAFHKVG